MKGSGEVAGQYSDPLYAGQAGMPVSPDLPQNPCRLRRNRLPEPFFEQSLLGLAR